MMEADPDMSTYDAKTCLDMAHGYERSRGGLSTPMADALAFTKWNCCTFEIPLRHYERARGMA